MEPIKIELCVVGRWRRELVQCSVDRGSGCVEANKTLLPQVGTEAAQRKYLTPRPLIKVIT
jgi:hypothetical protein